MSGRTLSAIGLGVVALATVGCGARQHRYAVPSDAMANTIKAGDHVLIDPDARPIVGSIVVFIGPPTWPAEGPHGTASRFVKRVIAVGGDTVTCRDDHLAVNGVASVEPYLYPGSHQCSGDAFEGRTVHVPIGDLFVLGDNRDASSDSRISGSVPVRDVVGVVSKIMAASGS